jgi:hypothetical protein
MNTRAALVREVGFDTLDALGAADHAGQLRATGLTFAMIYVEKTTKRIVQVLLQAGIDVCFLSEARIAEWSADSGAEDGKRAASLMLSLGVPGAVSLGCDMEAGVPDEPTAVAYANSWYNAAVSEGLGVDAPDLYVGAGSGFVSSDVLYEKVHFRRYFRSESIVPNVSVRDYCCYQLFPGNQELFGVETDFDVTQHDKLGGTLTFLTL